MKPSSISQLRSERSNPRSRDLDQKSALQIARIINREDAKVSGAVRRAIPQIARGIDEIADGLSRGGRLIYVGTGTSGRIGALDASECPPTFGTRSKQVQYLMAGGPRALGAAVEENEDDAELGRQEIALRKPGKDDVVVGIAASGRTPFTVAALREARRRGARTIAVTCNPRSPLERAAHMAIVTEVGPEVVTGSTRMKAGTAQKMVLNMLSTGAMVRMGYVYGNLMVHAHLKNEKLLERGITILKTATKCSRSAARAALKAAGNDISTALVMLQSGASREMAARVLERTHGHVREAIRQAKALRQAP
jgi:N-acetylmuramic acid 6-phosphate etherase